MLYGNLPVDLGLVNLNPVEMMFWMYCPIGTPSLNGYEIPANLEQYWPLIVAAAADYVKYKDDFLEQYIYITAKTLWVSGEYIGNRPGWHTDGFGTDDINYIWCDRAPTEFLDASYGLELSEDCDESMKQMTAVGNFAAAFCPDALVIYPDKHLLRLDPSVIHRCPVNFEPGMRTFIKISISKNRYNLVGNSVNHALPDAVGPLVPRAVERNHPSK